MPTQITGTAEAQSPKVDLKQGWNEIVWPYESSLGITSALVGLKFGKDYDQISTFNNATKTQEDFLNQPGSDTLTKFDPDKVYYIHMLGEKPIELGDPANIIINPTAEEVLQKVADNYKLIEDLKANMTVSTVLNEQSLGEAGFYIYYFKNPKKEKIETYSSAQRNEKTDIVIIDGVNMHLINPVTKAIQEVDLLNKAGIDSNQFNQMDICYNLPEFLKGHTIKINEGDSDLANFIVAIDALPDKENSLYAKLELNIDYKKGLLVKSLLFDGNSLKEKFEVQESQLMPNGAWVPVKMIKIPMLTSGNMVNTLVYSDIQINTGLSNDDFEPSKQ